MKGCCEKCGKELGFFERSLRINNSRINIQYDALCSNCHQRLKEGIEQVDQMYQHMIGNLKDKYAVTNMAGVALDTLLFLGIEALLVIEPNYYSEKTSLNQTIINRTERLVSKQNDMAKIVYKILAYGFSENLENAGLEKSKDFISYMQNNMLYMEQIAMNCSEEVPKTYVNVFFTRKGFIMEKIESHGLIYVTGPETGTIAYTKTGVDGVTTISFDNLYYDMDEKKNVICSIEEKSNVETLTQMIDRLNQKTVKQEERRIRDTLTIINEKVVRDLKALKPGEALESLHLDCILLCVVKNTLNDPDGQDTEVADPEGFVIQLIWKKYRENLADLGIDTIENLVDYIKRNCNFSDGFNIMYEKAEEHGWGFFAPRGFIINFYKTHRVFFIYDDTYPNDLYYPFNSMMFEGCQFLQLPMSEEDTEKLQGLVFRSREIKQIWQIERYFKRNNMFYLMNQFMHLEKEVYADAEKTAELKRVANKMFRDFRYSPFCSYDVWFAIQRSLKEEDILLNKLIPEKTGRQKRYSSGEDAFSSRIIEAFREGAKELQESLEIDINSVAKALLWCEFKDTLTETISQEWIRIAGDFVTAEDDLNSAFIKYSALEGIEPENAFFIGLFIYYLMDKGLLTETDFLDNYDRAVQTYIICQHKIGDDTPIDAGWQPVMEAPEDEEPIMEQEETEILEDVLKKASEENQDLEPIEMTEEEAGLFIRDEKIMSIIDDDEEDDDDEKCEEVEGLLSDERRD